MRIKKKFEYIYKTIWWLNNRMEITAQEYKK